MEDNYTVSFEVEQSPDEVYTALNNVRAWWSQDLQGQTQAVGDVFYFHYQDIHRSTIKVSELVPGKKVAWHVLHNAFNFTEDKSEWNDTDIIFEITEQGGKTRLKLTHVGLVPSNECYQACSDGWRTYIAGSLKNLITTGQGQPNLGEAITESEKHLS